MRAAKRDTNEPEIVAALEKAGCRVKRMHWADLVVQRGSGTHTHTFLLEVKTDNGTLTELQKQLKAEGWVIPTVRTPEEALEAVRCDLAQTIYRETVA